MPKPDRMKKKTDADVDGDPPRPTRLANAQFFIDDDPLGELDHLTHARSLLSQVYYRQNMYVASAQYCDKKDLNLYLIPIIIITAVASFLGFVAGSALMNKHEHIRTDVSLGSGILGVLATAITAIRNTAKFDVKAETFRGAAGQYRILATKLEARMREHRCLMHDEEKWGDPKVREEEQERFVHFFNVQYDQVLVAQSEMKFFPPAAAVRAWKRAKTLLPSEVDQPEVDRADQAKLLESFM